MSEQQYLELFHKFRKMQNTPDEYHQFREDIRRYEQDMEPSIISWFVVAILGFCIGVAIYPLLTVNP